jgi:hypothetical protein
MPILFSNRIELLLQLMGITKDPDYGASITPRAPTG